MKTMLLIGCFFIAQAINAQEGDELMVYSVKGNVAFVENNVESKLKIGRVIKPTAEAGLRVNPGGAVTLVCKAGQAFSVYKPGLYTVKRWKDSCRSDHSSVTSKYFRYVWDQMYVRSEDYKKEKGEATASVVRGTPPSTGRFEIFVDPAIDTIRYTGGSFPLAWEPGREYTGRYFFVLRNFNTGKVVFRDSVQENSIDLQRLSPLLKPGIVYKWSVTAPTADKTEGGVVIRATTQTLAKVIAALETVPGLHEDQAAKFFRTAFMLEEKRYLPSALAYYEKAARANSEYALYRDRLEEFRKQFRLL